MKTHIHVLLALLLFSNQPNHVHAIESKKVEPTNDSDPKNLSTTLNFQLEGYSSKVILRMNHMPLGRFDTVAEIALKGKITLHDSGVIRSSSITLELNKLISNVELRDNHMKEKYLQTKKFPLAEVKNFTTKVSEDWVPFTGVLLVKGIAKEISGESKLKQENNILKGQVKFNSNYSYFKIDPPSYMGIGTDPDFEVLVDLKGIPEIEMLDEMEVPKF